MNANGIANSVKRIAGIDLDCHKVKQNKDDDFHATPFRKAKET
jgi:hypothetical protein